LPRSGSALVLICYTYMVRPLSSLRGAKVLVLYYGVTLRLFSLLTFDPCTAVTLLNVATRHRSSSYFPLVKIAGVTILSTGYTRACLNRNPAEAGVTVVSRWSGHLRGSSLRPYTPLVFFHFARSSKRWLDSRKSTVLLSLQWHQRRDPQERTVCLE
jgi:hypothetical protein